MNIVPNPTSRNVVRVDEGILQSKGKFNECTAWLTDNYILTNNNPIKIYEAFERGFRHGIDFLEEKIESLKAKALEKGPDPVTDSNYFLHEPLGNKPLKLEHEDLLVEWFFESTYPTGHDNWLTFFATMKNYLLSNPRPDLASQIFFLREKYLGNVEPYSFWETLIKEAKESAQDLVTPVKILERKGLTQNRAKLGLVNAKGENLPSDLELTFDKYLDLLPSEYKTRVETYKRLQMWLLSYKAWRTSKTPAQILRYGVRRNENNPWGELAKFEEYLRIRRQLEGWRITPPPNVKVWEEILEEERISMIARLDSNHCMSQNPRMIPWYVEVNNRALIIKQRSAKGNKKRTSPTEAFEQHHKKAEHATFYNPWIKVGRRTFTILEVVENAYYGGTHKFDPEMSMIAHKAFFSNLLENLENSSDPIPNFPHIEDWNEAMNNQLLNDLTRVQPQYAKTIGIMFNIHQKQREISDLEKWKTYNNKRALAQQSPITLEEWKQIPSNVTGVSKESWYTGNLLPPTMYHMVAVESSSHPDYRKVMRARHKAHQFWKHTKEKKENNKDKEEEDGEEHVDDEDPESMVKCALCGEETDSSSCTALHIHKSHRSAFYKYAYRFRKNPPSDKENNVALTPSTPTTDLIPPPPPPPPAGKKEKDPYKRKYETLRQTVERWGKIADPEEVGRKVQEYVKRMKTGGDQDGSVPASPVTEIKQLFDS